MKECRCNAFDIMEGDFNPTVLFVSKRHMDSESRYHEHDFTEITYILSGHGQYYVEGITYPVKAGDLVICNAGVKHHNIVIDKKEPTVEFFVGFTNYRMKNSKENTLVIPDGNYIIHTEGTELRQNLNKLCYAMLSENEDTKAGRYFMLKSYLIQFVLLIIRAGMEPVPRQEGCSFENHNKSYVVSKIVDYIDMHYNKKISLDQIAQNMYLSAVYISKLFKEETGDTPINYLIKIRLEKAKELLEIRNGSSIKEIANDVGYEDVYHFSKLFKKYYGVSPLNYRNNIKKIV